MLAGALKPGWPLESGRGKLPGMATRISNAELGELIGVSHSMASRIRGGQRLPSVRTIREIHREFDVPLPELVDAHCSGRKAFAKLMEGILQERGEAQAV